ncbi:MAG: hypothetical protein ACLGHX_02195 [Acidimicrobiia bacterium]
MSGAKPADSGPFLPVGRFVSSGGIDWYRIDDYDCLDPFLVNLVTASDQWMFISSSGALTAGRRSAEHALFPYETDDRLHRNGGLVGPVTVIRVGSCVWEPFAAHVPFGRVRRAVSKTTDGTQLSFEEHHPGLGLTFRYTWATAEEFGFVRTCELAAESVEDVVEVDILDGLRDVLPSGVALATQQTASTLVDAYRRAELAEPEVAVFTLEALVSDRPEPAESLRANVVWSRGLAGSHITLSDSQLRRFRSGEDVTAQHLIKGRKAGFFISSRVRLEPGTSLTWVTVADVDRTHAELAGLRAWLRDTSSPSSHVRDGVETARRRLVDVVDAADGLQLSADRRSTVHHFSNVLFNVMRGGVFLDDHRVRMADVVRFVESRNAELSRRFASATEHLPEVVDIDKLKEDLTADEQLSRLVAEFLPLRFSRRHGDPSRPWNAFEISVDPVSGGAGVGYQGNWRDIFQNWEALVHSFPGYIESVIAKFLNASTVDGFNPYRVTDHGIDWEIPESGTWSNFGYWGDHQIVYLGRLLDAAERFYPGRLEQGLARVWHSYADVPYRIVSYDRLVEDPKSTIEFDEVRQATVDQRVERIGTDGRLVPARDGGVHLASLAEKLVVPVLAKVSNLVVGAGVWMNTQRPEWNDANNALVGNGVSVVTALHLDDFIRQVDSILAGYPAEHVPIGSAVVDWIDALRGVFESHSELAASDLIDPTDRRRMLDGLGTAFSEYRQRVYATGPGEPKPVEVESMRSFFATVQPFLEQVRRLAQREDGLFHSYWLMHLSTERADIEALYPMLEGQVAGMEGLGSADTLRLVDRLFESPLFRSDQRSFLLYPDRELPSFWEKNVVPDSHMTPEVETVLRDRPGVLTRDVEGRLRFDASFRSGRDLADRLAELDVDPSIALEILDLYEQTFRHAAFTGRSGTMYRYEGLGSVYWHMVSKLLLVIQHTIHREVDAGVPREEVSELVARYFRVRNGLGFLKSAAEQGTFPTDPHSHTPAHSGAQQPGMTGQVKEGVLLRWGELGVRVAGGTVRFHPVVLAATEFLERPGLWPRLGSQSAIDAGSLAFTYCSVPVVYHRLQAGEPWSKLRWADGGSSHGSEHLDAVTSAALFERRGRIERIDVGIPNPWLVS